jgi:hypothetical protein
MTYNTTFLRLFETILFCFVLFVSTVSRAQDTVIECDSALILPPDTNAVVSGCDADTMFSVAEYKDPTHRVRPAEWIVPSVAAVGGALCVKTAWGKQFRHWAQKNLSRHGEKKVWASQPETTALVSGGKIRAESHSITVSCARETVDTKSTKQKSIVSNNRKKVVLYVISCCENYTLLYI